MRILPSELAVLIERQHGVVTRRQALALGLTPEAVRQRLRSSWTPLLPGTYLTATGEPTTQQRERAALLYAGYGSMLTGVTVLRRFRFRYLPDDNRVHVLIPHSRQRSSTAGFVVIHRTRSMPTPWNLEGGIAAAPIAFAVAQVCRSLQDVQAARALVAEAVQRRRTTVERLLMELDDGSGKDDRLLRQVVSEVVDGARSAPEAEALVLFRRAGLPEGHRNCALYTTDGRWVAQPDEYWEDLGVAYESDSYEFHLGAQEAEATAARHRRMTALGIFVIHASPSHQRTRPEELVAEVRAALKAGAGRPRLPVVVRCRPGCPLRGRAAG